MYIKAFFYSQSIAYIYTQSNIMHLQFVGDKFTIL